MLKNLLKYTGGLFVFLTGFLVLSGSYIDDAEANGWGITDTLAIPFEDNSLTLAEKRKIDRISEYFSRIHRGGFNGAALVAQNGRVLYRNAYGYADVRRKEPLTADYSFQLASVSKQFTAVAIMLLKESGQLNYDDLVQRFYPDFPYKNITIRQLLSHRSGLPNYMYFCDQFWPDRNMPLTNQDLMCYMEERKPANYYRANRRHQYNNTNYGVLAAIVEKVSGLSFSQFMHSHVFRPLGMNNTHIYSLAEATHIPNMTKGYDVHGRRLKEAGVDYLDGVTGDKGVYSTLDDLLKWDQMLYSEKLLCQSTLEEAFTPANRELRGNNYGFGWRLCKNKDEDKIVYHRGWWHGFNSCFIRNVTDKSTIIILSNITNKCMGNTDELEAILNEG